VAPLAPVPPCGPALWPLWPPWSRPVAPPCGPCGNTCVPPQKGKPQVTFGSRLGHVLVTLGLFLDHFWDILPTRPESTRGLSYGPSGLKPGRITVFLYPNLFLFFNVANNTPKTELLGKVRKSSQMLAKFAKFAKVRKVCKSSQKFAKVRKGSQKFAKFDRVEISAL
jgi:hypothetical protein